MRVTRALHGRWRALRPAAREALAPLAEEAKRLALELRGRSDGEAARRELRRASEQLARAMVARAEADAELEEVEVRRLREELRRELERLAAGRDEERRRAA